MDAVGQVVWLLVARSQRKLHASAAGHHIQGGGHSIGGMKEEQALCGNPPLTTYWAAHTIKVHHATDFGKGSGSSRCSIEGR